MWFQTSGLVGVRRWCSSPLIRRINFQRIASHEAKRSYGTGCYGEERYEDMENYLEYEPGGFHPINLNDVLGQGRYRIIHKSSAMGQCIAWIAQDTLQKKLVALKMWKANDTHLGTQESTIINHLRKTFPLELGHGAIPEILDEFHEHGPMGSHLCQAMPLLGTRFEVFDDLLPTGKSGFLRLRPEKARKAMQSLTKTLSHIHHAGVVHNGKLYLY